MDAKEFFGELTEFSRRVFKKLRVGNQSPWGGVPMKNGAPKGVILHGTSAPEPLGSIGWFMKQELRSNVSAHVVIGQDWPAGYQDLAKDLPLIHELPAMIVECMPWNLVAQHATWTNATCYGVELVSLGEIRNFSGQWRDWRANWTKPYPREDPPVFSCGRYWDPYPLGQFETTVALLRNLRELAPLEEVWVLGHEQVQGVSTNVALGRDKRDPGPHFNLALLRGAVFHGVSGNLDDSSVSTPYFSSMDRYRNHTVCSWARTYWQAQVAAGEAFDGFVERCWWELERELWQPDFVKGKLSFTPLGRVALSLLGYHVYSIPVLDMQPEDLESVRIFQRMAGCTVDGDPGSETREALLSRLLDRGCIDRS